MGNGMWRSMCCAKCARFAERLYQVQLTQRPVQE